MKKIFKVSLVAIILMISVLIRLPYLDKPLNHVHEWFTAHTLTTLELWDKYGASNCAFIHVGTYPGQSNKFVSFSGDFFSDTGINYHITQPPFGNIFAYFIFKIFSLEFSILNLQLLNMVLSVFSALFLFLMIKNLMIGWGNTRDVSFLLSSIGLALYVSISKILFYQSNVFHGEMLGMHLYLVQLYLFGKAIVNKKCGNGLLIAIGVINFLAIYTSWYGSFVSLLIILVSLIYYKEYQFKSIALVLTITAIVPFLLMCYQYMMITDMSSILNYIFRRLEYRTGFQENWNGSSLGKYNDWESYKWFGKVFLETFKPVVYLIIMLFYILLVFAHRIKKTFISRSTDVLYAMQIITGGSFVLHSVVFFNATVMHSYYMIFFSVFLVITTIILLNSCYEILFQKVGLKIFSLKSGLLILPVIVILGLNILRYNNEYRTWNHDFKGIGQEMAAIVREDELIFARYRNPSIEYYLQRNIARWKVEEDLIGQLIKTGVSKGIIFEFDDDKKNVISWRRVEFEDNKLRMINEQGSSSDQWTGFVHRVNLNN